MNIVITGASRGIGLAEAKLFDRTGNQLFLVATTKNSFRGATFTNSTLIEADLSTANGVAKVISEVKAQTDHIDALINNVGVMIMKKFEDFSDEEIDQLINTNLRAHILLTKALVPLLQGDKTPQVIFMSSMAAKTYLVGESVYSATKSGITAFANVLRSEFAGKIRVSTIHAWGVNTWGASEPNDLMKPGDIGEVAEFIVSRPDSMLVESIDLGHPLGWRGAQAPWSPQ